METILKYLPYVLLFAVATMIVYGWGLWRTSRQNQDLANMLSAKGISAVEKERSFNQKRVRTFCKKSYCKAAFYAGFHRSH